MFENIQISLVRKFFGIRMRPSITQTPVTMEPWVAMGTVVATVTTVVTMLTIPRCSVFTITVTT
jgi:hypothetical protein